MTNATSALSLALGAAFLLAATAHADDYYKGKTIRLVVGTPTGGGYDAYGRLVARHLPRFIPGKPLIVVSNMPGASSMKAAAYLSTIAPRDGTVIGTFNKSMPLYQALGQNDFPLKTDQMSFIGSDSQSVEVLTVWYKTGVKTIAEAKRREIVMGADAGGTMSGYPALLNATLGTKFKIVTGYAGSNAVNYAMEQGEVEGRGSNPWISWKSTRPDWVKNGWITPLVQVGLKKAPDLPDVPLLIDLAETAEQRTMFTFVSEPISIERPYAGPPGMAAEPREILRRAFDAMVKDPDFLAEAARQDMDVDPHTGAEVEKIVREIVATPPAIVEKVNRIMSVREGEGRPATGGPKE